MARYVAIVIDGWRVPKNDGGIYKHAPYSVIVADTIGARETVREFALENYTTGRTRAAAMAALWADVAGLIVGLNAEVMSLEAVQAREGMGH